MKMQHLNFKNNNRMKKLATIFIILFLVSAGKDLTKVNIDPAANVVEIYNFCSTPIDIIAPTNFDAVLLKIEPDKKHLFVCGFDYLLIDTDCSAVKKLVKNGITTIIIFPDEKK